MTTPQPTRNPRDLRALAAAMALSTLAACGGGDGPPAPAVPAAPPTASTTISGAVVKGPVSGAQVCAYAVAGSARGPALGNCTTSDASGNYSLAVPAGTGPLWLEALGGTYTDEVTRALSSLPAGQPLVALATANGASVTSMLTPLTTLALNAARAAAGPAGTLDAAAYAAAAAQLRSAFNLPADLDISTTLPAFGTALNSHGSALTAISQMVANGTALAAILADSNPAALAAAFSVAVAAANPPTTPPATGTGTGGQASGGAPSASGSLTVSGLADFTPQATGFEVSLSSDGSGRPSYRFFVDTPRASGNGTDQRELKVDPAPSGGYTVALFDAATRQQSLCLANCLVTVTTPAGASHPVQLRFDNLALSGNRSLSGTLTGDAPGAAWRAADLPGATTSTLTLDGAPVAVLSSTDSLIDAGNGSMLRSISLRLSDGSVMALSRTGTDPFTVTRVLPPATIATCATACNISVVDAEGTRLRFASTSLSGGLALDGTVDFGRTSGSLVSSDLGSFTPVASTIGAVNASRTFTFNVLGTAAQAGLSLVTVELSGSRVVRAQATVGIGTQLLSCLDNGAGIGIPACDGITVAADGRTVTFANAVLRGGALGVAARHVSFNGSIVAKGP